MRNLHILLLKFPGYKLFITLLTKIKLRIFENVPLYNILKFIGLELDGAGIYQRASSVSFNILLAVFPLIIFLFTLIAYIPIDDLTAKILGVLSDVMPREAYITVRETIIDIASNKRGDLLSLGIFFTLYFASNGTNSLMNCFNKANEFYDNRTFFSRRITAINITILLILVLIVCSGLLIGAEFLVAIVDKKSDINSQISVYLLIISKWIITVALVFFAISVLFYFGPAYKERYRFISPGSVLATLLIIVTSIGFTYYVNNFGQYNKLYGSIGTVIVIMLWIYFNSLSLLIGYELNAGIYINKRIYLNLKKNIEKL